MTDASTNLKRAAQMIADARSVVILTGAGVSAESGLATFRDPEEGHWSKYDPMQLATLDAFNADPELVTRWYHWRFTRARDVQPDQKHQKRFHDLMRLGRRADIHEPCQPARQRQQQHQGIKQPMCRLRHELERGGFLFGRRRSAMPDAQRDTPKDEDRNQDPAKHMLRDQRVKRDFPPFDIGAPRARNAVIQNILQQDQQRDDPMQPDLCDRVSFGLGHIDSPAIRRHIHKHNVECARFRRGSGVIVDLFCHKPCDRQAQKEPDSRRHDNGLGVDHIHRQDRGDKDAGKRRAGKCVHDAEKAKHTGLLRVSIVQALCTRKFPARP